MAIKKGAFELYTQERKLPEKGQNKQTKSTHFFDDLYEGSNGSHTVHKQFTEEILDSENLTVKDPSDLEHSQIVIDNNSTKAPIKNNALAHKISSEEETFPEFDKPAIGSQLVHNRFTKNERDIDLEIQKNNNQFSTTQHSYFKSPSGFSRLIGNQREIIIALYKNMRVNKSDITEELTLEMIADLAGVNQKSLKNTLFRLTTAGYLSRAEQKNGRGGWVKYKINDQIIAELQEKDFFMTLKKTIK